MWFLWSFLLPKIHVGLIEISQFPHISALLLTKITNDLDDMPFRNTVFLTAALVPKVILRVGVSETDKKIISTSIIENSAMPKGYREGRIKLRPRIFLFHWGYLTKCKVSTFHYQGKQNEH